MFRKILVVLAVLLLGVTAAAAQSCQDIIDKRQALMKRNADMAKIGSAMIKGDTPFDLAKAKEIFATLPRTRRQCRHCFRIVRRPASTPRSAPAIWDKTADFKAAQDKFSADVKAAQDNLKDLDTFKAGFQSVGKDCGGCHQTFRVRPS